MIVFDRFIYYSMSSNINRFITKSNFIFTFVNILLIILIVFDYICGVTFLTHKTNCYFNYIRIN